MYSNRRRTGDLSFSACLYVCVSLEVDSAKNQVKMTTSLSNPEGTYNRAVHGEPRRYMLCEKETRYYLVLTILGSHLRESPPFFYFSRTYF